MHVLKHFYSRNKLKIENSIAKFNHVAYLDQKCFQGNIAFTFIETRPKVKYFGKVYVYCRLPVVTWYQIFSYYVKIIGSVMNSHNSYFIKLQDFQSCWDHTKTCCRQVHVQSILTANCHRNQLVSTATVSWDTVYQTWP